MSQTQPTVSETESSMVSIRKSATDLLNWGQDFFFYSNVKGQGWARASLAKCFSRMNVKKKKSCSRGN